MPDATYDGHFAPTPWKASCELRDGGSGDPSTGHMHHWIEDAIGGVIVAGCTEADAMLIVAAVNSHVKLTESVKQALDLLDGDIDIVRERLVAALAAAAPIKPARIGDQPRTAPALSETDIAALGTKATALAAADGWDGSWSRNVAKGADIRPGPMSRERWQDFTAAALKAIQSS